MVIVITIAVFVVNSHQFLQAYAHFVWRMLPKRTQIVIAQSYTDEENRLGHFPSKSHSYESAEPNFKLRSF